MPNTEAEPQWFALRVRARYEKTAGQVLENKGVESFAPTYRTRRRGLNRYRDIELPLFPGYIFCRIVNSARLPVLITPGVLGFVEFGRGPHPVDTAEIETLRRVILENVPCVPHPHLREGDRARIISGPLTGMEGLISNVRRSDTVVISITLLQRSVAVTVGQERVQALNGASSLPYLLPEPNGTLGACG